MYPFIRHTVSLIQAVSQVKNFNYKSVANSLKSSKGGHGKQFSLSTVKKLHCNFRCAREILLNKNF